MREAFSRQRSFLNDALASESTELAMIAFYKGKKPADSGRVSLAEIEQDVNMICRSIVSALKVKAK